MSLTGLGVLSDIDMQDPVEWYDGFKEALITKAPVSTKALSNERTGEHQASTVSFEVSDPRRDWRQAIVSPTGKYWTGLFEHYMTTRANRGVFGRAFPTFVGLLTECRPIRPLAFEVTLADIVTQNYMNDSNQIPWRLVGDGFLSQLSAIAEKLDKRQPEPIVYGENRRRVETDEASPQGFAVVPIYIGIQTIAGDDWHTGIIAGHACAAVPDGFCNGLSIIPTEGTDWLVPGHSGHTGIFGTSYEDYVSDTYGNTRRYTIVRGRVGDAGADAWAAGESALVMFVDGVEPNGDGTGEVITDRFLQYQDFVINYVANQGLNSYHTGDRLANPLLELADLDIALVDTDSFELCRLIGTIRLPLDPSADYAAGYIGAGVIGATPSDRASAVQWIAHWNVSCGVQHGFTYYGQFRIVALSPTPALKASSPTYTDSYEILKDSFDVTLDYQSQANVMPFVTDYHFETGTWKTTDSAQHADAIFNYGKEMVGETRQYRFAPGITMAYHLAVLDVRRNADPPILCKFKATIGPDAYNESLGYRNVGDYINYLHFAAVGDDAEVRLGQIQQITIDSGTRDVEVIVRDCEDLIDYDQPLVADEEPDGAIVAEATDIPYPDYTDTTNTDNHPTDETVTTPWGSPSLAYHAKWYSYTPPSDGSFTASTLGTLYDTRLAIFEADGVTLIDDTTGIGIGSYATLTVSVSSGVAIKILVSGYSADDSGVLTITTTFTPTVPSAGTTYYVSTSGSDINAGTLSAPKRTIAAGVALLGPGDTLYIRAGTYSHANDVIDSARFTVPSGTSWSVPVTISAYPAETVILQPPDGVHAIRLTTGAPSYVVCQDLTLDGINQTLVPATGQPALIYLSTGAHHNRFLRLDVKRNSGNGAEISANGGSADFNEFLDCLIHDNGRLAVMNTGYGIYNLSNDTLIEGCEIYGNNGYGVHHNPSSGGHRIRVIGNRLHGNRTHGSNGGYGTLSYAILVSRGSDALVINNLVYDNQAGISVYSNASNAGVYNNTVVDNDNEGLSAQYYTSAPTFRNNISYLNGTNYVDYGGTGTPTQDHNLIGTDPLFGTDYALTATSPARDTGATIAAVTDDFDGVARPQGSAYDIGAREYV